MDLGDVEACYNVVLSGSSGVGKTSLVSQFCQREYPSAHQQTIGVKYYEKTLPATDTHKAKLMISDVGGGKSLDALAPRYLGNATAVILVFSTVDRCSFLDLRKFHEKAVESGVQNFVIVQNKVDLLEESEVTSEEVEALARELGVKVYRTCCTTSLNVSRVFYYVAACCSEPKNSLDTTCIRAHDVRLEAPRDDRLPIASDQISSSTAPTRGGVIAEEGSQRQIAPSKVRTERKKSRCHVT